MKIVDIIKYRCRTIVIVKMDWGSSHGSWHNGYVSCRPSSGQIDYDKTYSIISADEPTFAGFLNNYEDKRIPQDMYFLGFDSVHGWNDETNNNQVSVTERAKEFADDMIKARI